MPSLRRRARSPSPAVRGSGGVCGARFSRLAPRRCCCPRAWRSRASNCRTPSSGHTGRSASSYPTRPVARPIPRPRRVRLRRAARPPARERRERTISARAARETAEGSLSARSDRDRRPTEQADRTSPAGGASEGLRISTARPARATSQRPRRASRAQTRCARADSSRPDRPAGAPARHQAPGSPRRVAARPKPWQRAADAHSRRAQSSSAARPRFRANSAAGRPAGGWWSSRRTRRRSAPSSRQRQ